jgi:hypothetical protein
MNLKLAIALLSGSAIAYEILLLRILSIIQWGHFAALVISLALLGYGASGVLLTASRDWLAQNHPARWQNLFVALASGFGVLMLVCVTAAQGVDFNPLALVWEPAQMLHLLHLFLLLAIPFLLAATAIGLALTFNRHVIGGLYGVDLLGAGAGALGVLGIMYLATPMTSLRIIAVLASLAAAASLWGWRQRAPHKLLWLLPLSSLLAASFWPRDWQRLRLSEFKPLHKVLLAPDTEVVVETHSPLAMLSVVRSPTIPFRYAPGLSLGFAGELPEQLAIFTDGGSMAVIDKVEKSLQELDYLDYLPSAAPYWLRARPSVLVLGAVGTGDLLLALRHSASNVRVVEANPQVVDLLLDPRNGLVSEWLGRPPIAFEIGEARSFLYSDQDTYDLIHVPLAGSMGGADSGSRALGVSYLFTTQSLMALLGRLNPGGILAINLWLRVPPRENLRLFATATEALRQSGAQDPGARMAQIRGWGTVTTLVKQGVFTNGEVSAIAEFCRRRSFDLTYLPGISPDQANRFNRLDEPYLYLGNRQILLDPESFLSAYKFDIRPTTDDWPFFFHTFRWRSLRELLGLAGRAGVPMVEWAYLVRVATVLQAAAAAGLFILLPLRWLRQGGKQAVSWKVPVFFASLGAAFMLVEMGLLQRFALYLGNPIYSVAIVLAGFLIFAGFGSLATRPSAPSFLAGPGAPGIAAALIVLVGMTYAIGLPPLLASTISRPLLIKVLITLTALAPIGFLMGMPFPSGLSRAAESRVVWVPWAWGINGSASVVGAAIAPLIAIHFGLSAVLLTGLLAYLIAGMTFGSGFSGVQREAIEQE